MAITPYQNSNDALENPSILASADGDTWVVPDGLTNPIAPYPGAGHLYDTDLLMVGDTLHCIYCEIQATGGNETETIHEKHSTDGISWSEEADLVTVTYPAGESLMLSPALHYDGSTFYMWTVDNTRSPAVIQRRTAAALTGPWSDPVDCTVTVNTGSPPTDIWHINVTRAAGRYWMVASLGTATGGALRLVVSTDGLSWLMASSNTLAGAPGTWDVRPYRGSIAYNGTDFDLWYGSNDGATPRAWRIGRTKITGVIMG
jgi:hypothetical protein